MALTFFVPVFLFPLSTAIFLRVGWGLGVLTVLSYQLARIQRTHPWKVISEHLVIAVAVIMTTHVR